MSITIMVLLVAVFVLGGVVLYSLLVVASDADDQVETKVESQGWEDARRNEMLLKEEKNGGH